MRTPTKEYIAFWRLEDRPSWLPKVQHYYFIDAIPIRDWSNNRERVYWRRPKRLRGMIPCGGSDWWSLSYGCAAYVLRFVEENPSFRRFFKYTHSPGELFFQTIILNSDRAGSVKNFEQYNMWRAARSKEQLRSEADMLPEETFNYRYVDWSRELTGERERPAVLDERDWEKIKSSKCHFARKFDPRRSAKLLDMIDREILGVSKANSVCAFATETYHVRSD